jgi:hypothetical protein
MSDKTRVIRQSRAKSECRIMSEMWIVEWNHYPRSGVYFKKREYGSGNNWTEAERIGVECEEGGCEIARRLEN